MRWIKHLSSAHDDAKINKVRDRFGAAGYGFYWLVLERVAGQLSSDNRRTILGDSAKGWGMFLGTRGDHARKVLEYFGECGLMMVTSSGNYIEINCPNLLKYKDESFQKSGRASRHAPEVEQNRTEQNRVESEHAPQQPETLRCFNDWITARESELIAYFNTSYAHVGGDKHLKKVVMEIREAIFLNPDDPKWLDHAKNGSWGDVVRGWNRIAVREAGR